MEKRETAEKKETQSATIATGPLLSLRPELDHDCDSKSLVAGGGCSGVLLRHSNHRLRSFQLDLRVSRQDMSHPHEALRVKPGYPTPLSGLSDFFTKDCGFFHQPDRRIALPHIKENRENITATSRLNNRCPRNFCDPF
jgi:hypothetical protein